jgi:hypothetical protein
MAQAAAGRRAQGLSVGIMHLFATVADWFRAPPRPDIERADRVAAEAERLLRQMRSELRLMRMWRQSERPEDER